MQSLTRGWKAKRLYVLENKEAKKNLFLSPCNIYIITLKAFLVSVDKLHSGNLQFRINYGLHSPYAHITEPNSREWRVSRWTRQ